MDHNDFVGLVASMRELQKTFFKTPHDQRPPDLIRRAKAAEKAVDREIELWNNGQRMLFGGDQ